MLAQAAGQGSLRFEAECGDGAGRLIGPEDFAGNWQLTRRIADHLADAEGVFDGTAVLTPETPGRLRYVETGTLRIGTAPPMQASRTYLWQFEPGRGAARVVVRFDDGRAFHSFAPQGVGRGTDHPCGADYYRVAYDFTDWPTWSAQWTVTGPRKNYAMQTFYRRG